MKGAPQKPMTGSLSPKCLHDELHGFGNVAEVGGAIGAQAGNVFGGADGLLDFRALSGGEVKGQAHDFERKKKVGEDDGRIDFENFGGLMVTSAASVRLFADFDQGILLADGAVLGHVASGLAHEPDGGPFDRLGLGGANEERIGGRHEPSNLAFSAECRVGDRLAPLLHGLKSQQFASGQRVVGVSGHFRLVFGDGPLAFAAGLKDLRQHEVESRESGPLLQGALGILSG